MRRRRSSILTLGIVAAVVALDCAWVRTTYWGGKSFFRMDAPAFDMGVLPMANVLALMLLWTRRRGAFFWGFLAGGVVSILVLMLPGWFTPNSVRFWLQPIYAFRERVWPWDAASYDLFAADAVYFTLQQMALAVLCGLAARRLARRLPTPEESAGPAAHDEPMSPAQSS